MIIENIDIKPKMMSEIVIALISSTITAIFGPIIVHYIKSISTKNKEKKLVHSFNKSLIIDNTINEELAKLVEKYGFNRVSIIDYHNGTTALNGFGFKNASMRYEKTDNITNSIIERFQSIPCSLVSDMLIELEKAPEGYVIDSDKGSSKTAITHRMYGVNKAYNFRIGDSLIHGCLSCVFTHDNNNKHYNTLTEDDILNIKASCQKIELLRNNI